MIQKTVLLLSLLFLSSCRQFTDQNQQGGFPSHTSANTCQVSANQILSCLASSQQLSAKDVCSEFDLLNKSLEEKTNSTNLNRLLCLSLQPHSSLKQLQQGESILEELLKKNACKQQNLTGLLHIIKGNIVLHKTYLDTNWKLYVQKKKLYEKKETLQQELDGEITSYQRRIQDLEKQVQKLIEIESMLDQKVQL